MRDNEGMSAPELVPRRPLGGIVAVWIFAALAGGAIGIFAPADWRAISMVLVLGTCLILSFVVQLWYGRPERFLHRMAVSVLGSLVVLGVISVVMGLVALLSVTPIR